MGDEPKKLFDASPQHPGDHLRELLAERGLTQEELAVITGRSRQQIIDIVTRRRGITPEMAVALGGCVWPETRLLADDGYGLSSFHCQRTKGRDHGTSAIVRVGTN